MAESIYNSPCFLLYSHHFLSVYVLAENAATFVKLGAIEGCFLLMLVLLDMIFATLLLHQGNFIYFTFEGKEKSIRAIKLSFLKALFKWTSVHTSASLDSF